MNSHMNDIERNVPVCPYHLQNTIELKHVVNSFLDNWKMSLGVIVFFAVLSYCLSIFIPKSYEVTSVLLPPNDSDVNRLNGFKYYAKDLFDDDFYLTVEKTYLLFLDNLRSVKLRNRFLAENELLLKLRSTIDNESQSIATFNEKFSKNLKVDYSSGGPSDTKFITVEFVWTNQEHISEILNDYIKFVDSETVKSIVDAIQQKIITEKQAINDKIQSLRIVAEINRKNEIDKITEDLYIAEKIEIFDPFNVSISSYKQTIDNNLGKIESSSETAGFLKGAKALKAELNIIKNRKNNDPFIPGLQQNLEQDEFLGRVLKLSFNDIHAMRIDKIATIPDEPVSPNKFLMVGVGIAFGFLISIFFILIKEIIIKNR